MTSKESNVSGMGARIRRDLPIIRSTSPNCEKVRKVHGTSNYITRPINYPNKQYNHDHAYEGETCFDNPAPINTNGKRIKRNLLNRVGSYKQSQSLR